MEILGYIATIVAIAGCALNAYQRISGFYLWIASNIYFIYYNIHNDTWFFVWLFVVYTGINLVGIYKWRKKGKENK